MVTVAAKHHGDPLAGEVGPSRALTTTHKGYLPGVHAKTLATAHGYFNLVTGAWPILNMSTFELALGPKEDTWLVKTVGGLLATTGLTQLASPPDERSLEQARRLGMAISGTLLAIDFWYGGRGRISRRYLLDGVLQGVWLVAWMRSTAPAAGRPARR